MMRPIRSILDTSFCYVPSVATSVASTWRRAGWRPTTDEERKARHIERRKTQPADRDVQDARSTSAYRDAMTSPL